MLNPIKWILSVRYWKTDNTIGTVHVVCDSEEEAEYTKKNFMKQFGPEPEPGDLVITQVPATWECSGNDGCLIN